MESKQKLLPQNKTYEKALIWFETQTVYQINAEIKGQYVYMKLLKNGIVVKESIEPFDVNYHLVIQEKILNLYNYDRR